MEVKYYYSLKDLEGSDTYVGWGNFFSKWGLTYVDSTYTNQLFLYVEDDCLVRDLFILEVEQEPWAMPKKPTLDELKTTYIEEVKVFLKRIRGWLNKTSFRYSKLIALFQEQENNLLKQIESTTTSKFNDTPQTTTVGLADDKYATTYSVSSTSVDNGSVMARLNEVRNSYSSLYAEWVEDFRAKFIL